MSLTFPLVPDEDNPNYVIRVPLDGATYIFEFRWSAREVCWYVDMLDEQEDPIHLGQKLVVSFPLFTRTRDERKPPGLITAFDTTGGFVNPGLDDLGGRVLLLYYTAAELIELFP